MKNHKKIGIIGGVGPQATQFIYSKIIELSQIKYGAKNNDDYPQLIIESVPIPDFISDVSKIDIATRMLIESTRYLTKAGVTKICIASNTVHILQNELEKNTTVPFISMIELVAKKCSTSNFNRVGLLGSPVLIKSGLYETELKKYGIGVIFPTNHETEIADSIIRDVLAGRNSSDKKQAYVEAMNNIFDRGAQTIILGCTELPLALNYEALGDKTISSDEVLAEGIVDYYYGKWTAPLP